MPYVDGQWVGIGGAGYGGSKQQAQDLEKKGQEAKAAGRVDVAGNAYLGNDAGWASYQAAHPAATPAAPQVSAPSVSVPTVSVSSAPASAPQLQTFASQADPNSTQFLGQLQGRVAQQQANENAPVTASAQRATDLASRNIYDAAAAERKKKQEELVARGLSGMAGAGAGQLRAIDEAAKTRAARATADIGLGREQQQDTLNIARQGMTNALYGQLGAASQVPFQQQMAGNQQALNTWQANDASQMGRANLNLQAQQTNAQLAMQAQQMAAQQQAQQQQQQMAMWQALMGMQY